MPGSSNRKSLEIIRETLAKSVIGPLGYWRRTGFADMQKQIKTAQ